MAYTISFDLVCLSCRMVKVKVKEKAWSILAEVRISRQLLETVNRRKLEDLGQTIANKMCQLINLVERGAQGEIEEKRK